MTITLSNGEIIILERGIDSSVILSRFNPDGSEDVSFGTSGKGIINLHSNDVAMTSLLLQPDQKLLVGGMSDDTTGEQTFTIARFIIDTATGIHDKVAVDDLLEIYPNPTKSILHLKYNNLHIQSMELVDLSGRVIKIFQPNSKNLDIFGMAAGVYFLKVKAKEGEMTKKILICSQ